jgi:ABC-type transporter Mla maintaining outer membrane lipid asymmetry ATPase subunit MlaF
MEPASPVIELDQVCFSYRSREILHNVNLRIPLGP